MRIILLNGWIASGKDTVADYIVSKYKYKKLSFSKILKDHVAVKYNISRKLLDTQDGKNTIYSPDITYRRLLINTSSDIKNILPSYFPDKVLESINQMARNTNVVIQDFRFPIEYEVFKNSDYDIKTVNISRHLQIPLDDPSEKSLQDFNFDYHIDNASNLNDLYFQVDTMIKNLDNYC